MNLQNKTEWYSKTLTFIIIVLILKQYSLVFAGINTAYGELINYILCIILLLIYILYDIQENSIKINNIVLGFCFVILFIIFRKQQLLLLFVFSFSFLHITPLKSVFVYRDAIFLAVVINFVLAIFTHNLLNTNREAIAFGFGNQNTIGFYLILGGILFSLKEDGTGKLTIKSNSYIYILLLIDTLVVTMFFDDFTALILILVFLISYYFFTRTNVLSKKVICNFIEILPLILAWLTYWLAMNYGRYSWINSLDQLISGRINIWNYYFTRMPIKLFSNNYLFVVSAWGSNYTPHQGLFDGTYAYLLYILGVLFTAIYVLGLMICNYKLITSKRYVILALMIAIEVCGFSENILYSISCCFGSVFALLSFHNSWVSSMEKME